MVKKVKTTNTIINIKPKNRNTMKQYIISLLLISIQGIGFAFPQSPNRNYVSIRTYTDSLEINYLDEIQYFDGLGRPIQTIQKGITPNHSDLVSFKEYGRSGRDSVSWLPGVVQGNNGSFVADPRQVIRNSRGDMSPYSTILYENSPLDKEVSQSGPGQDWYDNGKSVKTEYYTNNTTDNNLKCCYFYVSGNNLVRNNYYVASQLYITKVMDEDCNTGYEFKDKQGRVVMTRQMNQNTTHDTYYVYDGHGNTRYVLSPMAIPSMGNGSYTPNSDIVKKYCYYYAYDSRLRCVEKRLPGCDPVYIKYDRQDQPIFTQDGEQRLKGEWTFSIPDVFGRTVVTGICKNPAITANTTVKAQFVQDQQNHGFQNTGYTYTGATFTFVSLLKVDYYDNYLFKQLPAFSGKSYLDYNIPAGFTDTRYGDETDRVKSKGLLMGSQVFLMETSGSIVSIHYYNRKAQPIQSVSTTATGGFERQSIAYDFTGNILRKQIDSGDIIENYRYTYDHAGRAKTTYYSLNGSPETTMSDLGYNELGQLQSKKVGNNRETTIYEYNIRGWQTKQQSSRFTQELFYNSTPSEGQPVYYTGNISAQRWQSADHPGLPRGYTFKYDGLQRLEKAAYFEGDDWTEEHGGYNERIGYDRNGNINMMKRNSYIPSMDDYYETDNVLVTQRNGNQLAETVDFAYDFYDNNLMEFKYKFGQGQQYAYNRNGCLTKDLNRNILEIKYNALNLPRSIWIGAYSVAYTYDATGVKRQTEHTTDENGCLEIFRRYYNGNKIYNDNGLEMILTEEGYIKPDGAGFKSYYYQKDHLGNNRVVVKEDSSVAQVTNYYPFGAVFAEKSPLSHPESQPYKFGNKELDRMFGLDMYDFLARGYYAALGSFTTMDPLAEKHPETSPYVYCANNPILNIDPTGEDYWSTSDPELIRQFMNAMGSGATLHDFSGWNHATDAEFVGRGTYDDGTKKFYTSYGTVQDEVVTIVGVSFDVNLTPVSSDGYGYPGAFVYEYGNEAWSPLYGFMYEITPFSGLLGPIDPSRYGPWKVNSSGRITGLAPITGMPPAVGKGGKGERGFTSSPKGTNNPFKKMKPDPNNPKKIQMKDVNGKTVTKEKPEGFDEYWNNKR